jgi:disulfide bond formation protein DsbB
LCIFQRLLFMIMSVLAFIAFFAARHSVGWVASILTLLTALSGTGVAGYQVWLQAQHSAMYSCGGGNPNLIERLVDWLGHQVPFLFLATGECQDTALLIIGFSLAAWSLAIFAAKAMVSIWALVNTRRD